MPRSTERMPLTLVTGPVRSGKSTFAATLARKRGVPVIHLATAPRYDDDEEWRARIERHAGVRPAGWTHLETATWDDAAWEACLQEPSDRTLVVDSLGGWLVARMDLLRTIHGDDASALAAALDLDAARFADRLRGAAGFAVVVSEQTGWGIVPAYPSGRIFRDVLGRLERNLAQAAAQIYLVVAGFAVDLRAAGLPITESE